MSGAGKSLLCTALCRIFAQDGWRVAPFKSQNMALNSCITADGLEMGRAQAVQAQAAGCEPDVRMNPILLKPSSDTGSQVIVNGEVWGDYSAADYFKNKTRLVPHVLEAYNSLAEENDILVIEGAGSPAEINLRENDIVNMGLAELVDAPVLLAGDIDRGGVFAQLYGTVALLKEEERKRVKGLIINKFRGDVGILRPGLAQLEELTGLPVVGVIPYTRVDIDDEDSLAPRLNAHEAHRPVDVAVIRLPHISNFTDFSPLESHPALGVRYVEQAAGLGAPDLIVLPGTKSTMADLSWMRQNGLEAAVRKLAAAGTPVLGVCGGYQMLGQTLRDPEGVEQAGEMRGMGLLPCETEFTPSKVRTRTTAKVMADPFAGASIQGYEIHMGDTRMEDGEIRMGDIRIEDREFSPWIRLSDGRLDGMINRDQTVMGTYLHGIFDEGDFLLRLVRPLMERYGLKDGTAVENGGGIGDIRAYKEMEYDKLAALVRKSLDMEMIYQIIGGKSNV